ncbi:MAG: MFS transporter [Actinobacteria bacterium]|nr:MFS transporter [Actinomycetota bacterium]
MRALLLLAGAIVFVDTLFFAALTPLLPQYADELGLGKGGAGLLAAAYPAGALVGALPSGMVAARAGVKPTVLAGLTCVALTTILFGFAGTAWQLDLARFAQGLASAFSWTGALAWLVAAAPPGRRGALIGQAFAAAVAGALCGPVLGGIASVAGARATFGLVGVASLALAGWTLAVPAARPQEPQGIGMLARAFGDRRVLGAFWFVVLPGLLFGALGVLAPLRLSALGFGSLAIGATWLCAGTLEAGNNVLLGRLSDRLGPLAPIRAGLLASVVVAALLPWPGNRFVLAALVVCAGLAFGAFFTPAMTLLTQVSEERGLDYGYTFALVNLAWAPGQSGGASLGGAVAGATSDAVPYLALAAICALTLVGLWKAAGQSNGSTTPLARASSGS